ncbi:hypothetical protein SAMN05421799_105137 [Alicyclobacillus vulcanalis]|uniref:Uncharacterized protein n=1 Tax=Alicyclobacillus vulcanalis TaxID=252246 RepID=A0A1N7MGJ2_9BACL|nr:hypothetical protein SAMN05421799_105137 [Alicyclobacillus vulcanalis]
MGNTPKPTSPPEAHAPTAKAAETPDSSYAAALPAWDLLPPHSLLNRVKKK